MTPLFEIGPEYDKHIVAIINYMLGKLKNKNPSKEDKCYIRTVNFIQEIYDGKFSKHSFNLSRKDYEYTDCFDKINECKGSWQKTRKIIQDSIDNLELAKNKEYLPFNKTFVNSISFSSFFEYFDVNSKVPGMNSNFLNFINPPKKCYEYSSELTIEKLKKNCNNNLLLVAEKIADRYFSDKGKALSFWYNIEDLSRWLDLFKSTFKKEYSEFILNCKNGNPLSDFYDYLLKTLTYKQGDSIVMIPAYFQLSRIGSTQLEYYFLGWLKNGIENGKFTILKKLPKSIDQYYTDESFKKIEKQEVRKEIVDFDNFVF